MQRARNLLLLLPLVLFSCRGKEVHSDSAPWDSLSHEAYVVMVSLDGFRWDYPDLYETPTLDSIETMGVKVKALLPSFPTNTFPNHYSLATGLYPDNHGIINNNFWAPDLQKHYSIGDRSMVENADFYYGEPIWVSAERQGQRSACYFWVGSEAAVGGIHPSYWYTYDGSVPYPQRIEQAISWLQLPYAERPSLIMLYFDQPDGVGHDHGPEAQQTGQVVTSLDAWLAELRKGLAGLPFAERINLLVLSDHGMGPISAERYINLKAHIPERWIDQLTGGNPVYLLSPEAGKADSVCMVLDDVEGLSAWQGEEIPEHLNYGSSLRFPGIVIVADPLWSIGLREDPSGYTGGAHGYDNRYRDMHAIFYAEGPAFKKGFEAEPFANVEVYSIVAHLLGLDPAETDGDLENVRELFIEVP